jgi:hypothetical protein
MVLYALPLLLLLAGPAFSQDVALPRPDPREAAGPPGAQAASPLPRPDPRRADEPAAPSPAAPEAAPADDAPARDEGAEDGPAGLAGPARIYQSACPAVISGLVTAKSLPPIAEGICGEQSPLAVTGVMANGRAVAFSGEAILSCAMASALPGWTADVDNYLRAREETGIAKVLVGTSYMCRNVNNGASGNLSFHAFANALDVVGFVLEDGRRIALPEGWADPLSLEGRALRFAHDAACARFSTTLGPEANALHRDHIHLDMGCHGGHCIARLCE